MKLRTEVKSFGEGECTTAEDKMSFLDDIAYIPVPGS